MKEILKAKENLYTKNCKDCGRVFRTEKPKTKFCPSCSEARKKAKSWAQEAKKYRAAAAEISIPEMTRRIERYNKDHGTCYTYGQYMALVHSGVIKSDER